MKKLLLLLISIAISLSSRSQLRQGEWRDHLSYNMGYRIAVADNIVYCASQSGLLSYDKNTKEVKKHSKATGLSDVEVSTIEYSQSQKCLIVGYKNGNVDLIKDGGTLKNLSDIKRKSITGSKIINRIVAYDHDAYLACDLGIIVIDLQKNEIKDSYFFGEDGTNIKVNDVTIFNNSIYAATESGIYTASLSSPNLVDYNYWSRLDFIPQSTSEYKFIEKLNDKLYAVYVQNSTNEYYIISIVNGIYHNTNLTHALVINDLSSSNGYLCLSGNDSYIYDQNEKLVNEFKQTWNAHHIYIDIDINQTIYMASTWSGFNIVKGENNLQYLIVNGPRFREVSQVATLGDHVWVSSGGPQNMYNNGGAYSFINGKWTSYNGDIIVTQPYLGNVYKIGIDSRDYTHVYGGTYGYGLIEFRNGEVFKIYSRINTELFSDISQAVDVRISGLQFDSQNNLWFLLNLVSRPLFIIKADGSWERPELSNNLLNSEAISYSDLLVTRSGQIWILSANKGIIVLAENSSGSFDETSFSLINQVGDPLAKAYCLDEDNEGNIWVGTNSGPLIYYSPSRVFETAETTTGDQIKIPRNDGTSNADFLLAGEVILDIKTDGGNRKWIATENSGVFLLSVDGKETLLNFRDDNSPILSNSVSGIGINEKDGEVFFATSRGLISYKGIATKGFSDFTDVYVYPNPVRPDFEGNITIKGLIENTIVKITDVSGNLVYETKSLGAQAVWDGKNLDGHRVATGVYLVFLSSSDGEKTYVTKLLFIH